jgi:hypothetical protein
MIPTVPVKRPTKSRWCGVRFSPGKRASVRTQNAAAVMAA